MRTTARLRRWVAWLRRGLPPEVITALVPTEESDSGAIDIVDVEEEGAP